MVQMVLHRTFYKGHIAFDLPDVSGLRDAVIRELTKCRDKHNDYVLVTLQPPKKPRTTGEGSQNHHLNGHIMQICQETGNDYDTVKLAVKMIAVEQFGYSFKTVGKQIVPKPERECSTVECGMLIEAAHYLAADIGIILKEE